MKQQPDLDVVDELARLASNADAPALDDAAARRMIDAAAAAPRRAVTPRRRGFGWPLAAAACAGLAAYAWFVHRPSAPAPEAELLRVTLPTGDRLVGTAGVRFEIVELVPASRRLQLRTGAMVFDVAHVAHDQRFAVSTDHATVIATGTVFSVEATAASTRVHVFEGSVAIEHGGQRDSLAAGASWSSDRSDSGPASITAAGEDFARERAASAARPAPDVPTASPSTSVTTATAPIASASSTTKPATPSSATIDPAPASTPPRVAATAPATAPRATSAVSPPGTTAPRAAVTAPSAGGSIEPAVIDARVAAPSDLSSARADVAAGRYAEALAKANAPLREGESGAWDLVRGDALRALGRAAEAADAFESAARSLAAPAKLEAAYSAAYLRHHDLKEHARALANLAGTDEPGSLFEERALVLRVDVLMTLDRKNEAAAIAGRYLDRFPKGTSAKLMRALITTR